MNTRPTSFCNKTSGGRVCVIGSANVDCVARVRRFPAPGESLVAQASLTAAGGKGANQAAAAHMAGAQVDYFGKVGSDSNADFLRQHFNRLGLSAHLWDTAEKPTGNALIYVCLENGENMIAVDPGANMTISEAQVADCRSFIEESEVVLLQLEINQDAQEKIINIVARLKEQCGEGRAPRLILNPAPYCDFPKNWLIHTDILTPNSTEAAQMSGLPNVDLDNAAQAAAKLRAMGAANVLITLGAQGAWLSTPNGDCRIAPAPASPVDTTGAGDAFNGALAARIAKGDDLPQAAAFACAYAAVSTERKGAAQNLPTAQDAWERIKKAK